MDLRLNAEEERARAAVAGVAARLIAGGAEPPADECLRELGAAGALSWTAHLPSVLAAEELGRRLLRGLYLDTLAAREVLPEGGLLDRVGSGAEPVALALPYGLRLDTAAEAPELSGGRLRGRVRFVAWAPQASRLLVGARDEAGSAVLALVPARQAGVAHAAHDEISRGGQYQVTFSDAAIGEDDVLHRGAAAEAALERLRWTARLRQAAYLGGMAAGALEPTMEYVKRRQAFGRRLASFQALAFRIAALHTRVDATRLLVRSVACRAEREDVRLAATQAHGVAAALATEAVAECVQMHGAFGITDRSPVQRHYLQASVERIRLGRPGDLLDEAAALLAESRRTPVEARS
jgi:alkylation response protein AidB-like acyl-CoA dehydrogenase